MHAGFQAPAPGLYSTAARGKVWNVLKKLKVAVLFGGASSEHEVSRMSATSVLNEQLGLQGAATLAAQLCRASAEAEQ